MRKTQWVQWVGSQRVGLRCGAVACFLCTGMIGCTTTDPSSGRTGEPEDVPILREYHGDFSRLARPVRIVIRDDALLAKLPLTEVDVDFEHEMLLLAGLGPTFHAGMGIRLVSVWRDGFHLHVQERQITGEHNSQSQVEKFSPWTMVVIPKSNGNVEGYSARLPSNAWAWDAP